jgi:hypothetical protein
MSIKTQLRKAIRDGKPKSNAEREAIRAAQHNRAYAAFFDEVGRLGIPSPFQLVEVPISEVLKKP